MRKHVLSKKWMVIPKLRKREYGFGKRFSHAFYGAFVYGHAKKENK